MREIKFRVWCCVDRWAYEVTFFSSGGWEARSGIEGYNENDGAILMQFTGFQDKNGKDIYEGDICKIEDGMVYSSVAHRMIEGHYQVYWNTDRWGLQVSQFEDYDNGDYYHGDVIDWNKCEVIGNIYDNPELLEEVQ